MTRIAAKDVLQFRRSLDVNRYHLRVRLPDSVREQDGTPAKHTEVVLGDVKRGFYTRAHTFDGIEEQANGTFKVFTHTGRRGTRRCIHWTWTVAPDDILALFKHALY